MKSILCREGAVFSQSFLIHSWNIYFSSLAAPLSPFLLLLCCVGIRVFCLALETQGQTKSHSCVCSLTKSFFNLKYPRLYTRLAVFRYTRNPTRKKREVPPTGYSVVTYNLNIEIYLSWHPLGCGVPPPKTASFQKVAG